MSGFVLGVRLAAAVLVLCAVAAGQGWFLYGLVRQNGRVLARLENLEQRIRIGGQPGTAGLAGVRYASGQGPVRGLAVGVPAPEFELPAVDGRRVLLRALLGRGLPVLLLFSVPGCGHCDALLPQVAGWQQQHRDRLTVALASRRSAGQKAATPEAHGLRDVLLQANREIAEAYQVNGTPSAVLIGANGKTRARGRRRRQSPSSSTAQPPAASRPSQRRHAPPAPRDQAHKTSPDLPPAPRHPTLRGPICRSLRSAAGGSRVSQCRYRIESF